MAIIDKFNKRISKITKKMVKCNICKNQIKELFLEKLKGTIIKKSGSNKQYEVCFECQKKFKTKEEMLEKI